jgi:hypothetical protein
MLEKHPTSWVALLPMGSRHLYSVLVNALLAILTAKFLVQQTAHHQEAQLDCITSSYLLLTQQQSRMGCIY